MRTRWFTAIAAAWLFVAGCAGGDGGSSADGGTAGDTADVKAGDGSGGPAGDTGSEPDSSALPDTGTPDTTKPDVATPDVATPDVATPDTATPDSGTPDTATPDVAAPDTTLDASLPDVAEDATPPEDTADGAVTDAGASDTTDAGWPDADDVVLPDAQEPDAEEPDALVDVTVPDDITGGDDVTDVATDAGTDEDVADVSVDAGFPDAGEDTTDAGGPPSVCDNTKPVPLPFTKVAGFGGSEDFAMDYEGNVVLNKGGSIVRVTPDGKVKVAAANAGATAGIAVLQNNDVVFCAGDKLKIAYSSGGYDTLLAGLAYPNGIDVDLEDYAYVAEQNAGRLRRVNTKTGEFEVVTDKLYNPNGVAWAPGYQRVYVGSFGGGQVWSIDRLPGGKWSEPVVFATIKGDSTVTGPPLDPIDPPEVIYDPCALREAGDPCVTAAGWKGTCTGTEGALTCEQLPDAIAPELFACQGAAVGDTCYQSVLGFPFKGQCFSDQFSQDCCEITNKQGCGSQPCEDCICAVDSYCCDTAWDGICVGETKSHCPTECNCDAAGTGGTGGGTGELSCYAEPNPVSFCKGLQEGDICAYVESVDSILGGRCMDTSTVSLPDPFPTHGIACVPPELLQKPGGGGSGGGLDGLNVDECGYVYVAEYVTGYLWRVSPDGVIYKAAALPSSWIPNIDFGRGVGGWPETTMYVMDLNANQLFAFDIGVKAKWAIPTLPTP